MVFSTKKLALAITEQLVCLCMLGLGIYFIYQGQVLQKFHLMRTNFAVYRERIFELPTIMIYIYYGNQNASNYDFKLGRDFEIQFKTGILALPLDGINLTLGENQIKDSDLKVNLADYNDPNLFRITPINFTSSMQTDFNFKYILQK